MKNKDKEILENKQMLRKQMKGIEAPKDLNDLQAKIEERARQREKLFQGHPDRLVPS